MRENDVEGEFRPAVRLPLRRDEARPREEIVLREDRRLLEVLVVERHVLQDDVVRIGAACGGPCMAFAPCADGADVEELHVRMAVVAFRQFGQQMVEFFQEDRIVEVWFPMTSVWLFASARREAITFRSGLFDPFRRRVAEGRFGAGDAEGSLEAARAVALHGRVQNGPFEMAFLRFDERPREAQIDLRDAFPVVQHVFRSKTGAVGLDVIVVEMEDEAHAGIRQFFSIILERNGLQVRREDCGGHADGGEEEFFHES